MRDWLPLSAPPALLAVLACIAPLACGAPEVVPDATLRPDAQENEPERPPEPPRYVLVHRNSQIHFKPSEDSAYLQYRTPERQTEFDARLEADEAKRLEREQESNTKRREKEKARRDKTRKRRRKYSSRKRRELRERDKERAEKRRESRASRELRAQRKRARKARSEAFHRWWIPFEVISNDAGWLEVRAVSRDAEPAHCFQKNFGELDRLDGSFWVREDDVAPVVRKRTRIPLHRGTEATLLPGVAVREIGSADPQEFIAYVDGFALPLPIPADAIDSWYRPERPFEAPYTDTVFTDIALAENKLRFGRSTFPYNPYRSLFVTGTLQVDSRLYATTQTPCGEFTVRAGEDLLEPVGRRGTTRLTGDTPGVVAPFARAGAIAYLPDGERFGKVLTDFPIGEPTGSQKGRECWRTAVWGKSNSAVQRSIELCFEPETLQLAEEK